MRTPLEGGFLDRRENILAFRNPGGGKTHLLCAIEHELIHAGGRIYLTSYSLLVQELLRTKHDLALDKRLEGLARFDALITDDIGYVQHDREKMEVLFTLVAERYERGSIMLSSNLPFFQWKRILKKPVTTAAAIDRLVHHRVIVEPNLDSSGIESAKRKEEQETDTEHTVLP